MAPLACLCFLRWKKRELTLLDRGFQRWNQLYLQRVIAAVRLFLPKWNVVAGIVHDVLTRSNKAMVFCSVDYSRVARPKTSTRQKTKGVPLLRRVTGQSPRVAIRVKSKSNSNSNSNASFLSDVKDLNLSYDFLFIIYSVYIINVSFNSQFFSSKPSIRKSIILQVNFTGGRSRSRSSCCRNNFNESCNLKFKIINSDNHL